MRGGGEEGCVVWCFFCLFLKYVFQLVFTVFFFVCFLISIFLLFFGGFADGLIENWCQGIILEFVVVICLRILGCDCLRIHAVVTALECLL